MPQTNSTEMILWDLYRTLSDLDLDTTIQGLKSDGDDVIRFIGKANGYREAANIVLEMHKKVC